MPDKTTLQQVLEQHTMAAAPALVRAEDGKLHCLCCAFECRIPEGKTGICCVRTNRNGTLRVPGGYVAGLAADPIEKKPFYHVYPGREALSFGMLGCNFRCPFCQNWISSQVLKDERARGAPQPITAGRLAAMAVEEQCPIMVSTYNEPLITSDWSAQVFEEAKGRNLLCGYISNGFATRQSLEFLRPYLDICNVDLKCFTEANYRRLGARLKDVLATIERLVEMGVWVEVVTLVVPGFNDSTAELGGIAGFVAQLSPDIPWHVTGFHPNYQMTTTAATRPSDLERAYNLGKDAGLKFVYSGNRPGEVGSTENTSCASCGAVLIERYGFYVLSNIMEEGGRCPKCNSAVPGRWEASPPRRSQKWGSPRFLW